VQEVLGDRGDDLVRHRRRRRVRIEGGRLLIEPEDERAAALRVDGARGGSQGEDERGGQGEASDTEASGEASGRHRGLPSRFFSPRKWRAGGGTSSAGRRTARGRPAAAAEAPGLGVE